MINNPTSAAQDDDSLDHRAYQAYAHDLAASYVLAPVFLVAATPRYGGFLQTHLLSRLLADFGKRRIDSATGRAQYGQRFAIVEPVFANLWHNNSSLGSRSGVARRWRPKWRLFCLVHNIEKLAHAGYAA